MGRNQARRAHTQGAAGGAPTEAPRPHNAARERLAGNTDRAGAPAMEEVMLTPAERVVLAVYREGMHNHNTRCRAWWTELRALAEKIIKDHGGHV